MSENNNRYDLIIRVYCSKIANVILNTLLSCLIICIPIILIILATLLLKICWTSLLKSNFFIGFFSALVGGLLGLIGIRIQLNTNKKKESLKYEYEHIIIKLDERMDTMIDCIHQYNFSGIIHEIHNCIKPFDYKYMMNRNVKKYFKNIENLCNENEKIKTNLKNQIFEITHNLLNENENLSIVIPEVNQEIILRKIINNEAFSVFNSVGKEINDIYNPNKVMKMQICELDKYKEMQNNKKEIFKYLISLKTYYFFYIGFTKDKLYF